MWLRAQKNRSELFGLYAPPSLLPNLVPKDSVVVDAGAAIGLYSYFFGKRASTVYAFEPNPFMYRRLERAAGRKIVPQNVALSDHDGIATLYVPTGDSYRSSLVARPDGAAASRDIEVEVKPLDGYQLSDVGLVKIDVEGHEDAVLRGARHTLEACRPVVLIEVEERHRAGSVNQVTEWFEMLGYREAMFLNEGRFRPMSEFDLDRHQLAHADTPNVAGYCGNFLFTP